MALTGVQHAGYVDVNWKKIEEDLDIIMLEKEGPNLTDDETKINENIGKEMLEQILAANEKSEDDETDQELLAKLNRLHRNLGYPGTERWQYF